MVIIMKKILLIISFLLIPLPTLAYSDYIYRGGNTLGIELDCDGILIVGFYEVDGSFNKGNPKLKIGDYIKKVNGEEVNTLKELPKTIEKYVDDGEVEITYTRDKKEEVTTLPLLNENGVYNRIIC